MFRTKPPRVSALKRIRNFVNPDRALDEELEREQDELEQLTRTLRIQEQAEVHRDRFLYESFASLQAVIPQELDNPVKNPAQVILTTKSLLRDIPSALKGIGSGAPTQARRETFYKLQLFLEQLPQSKVAGASKYSLSDIPQAGETLQHQCVSSLSKLLASLCKGPEYSPDEYSKLKNMTKKTYRKQIPLFCRNGNDLLCG